MTLEQILFIISGAITLGAALMVVTRRNTFHAAMFLILSLSGVAGLYALLEAPFLAAVQLFIYAGGIAIVVTLTRDTTNLLGNGVGRNRQWWAAALVAAALCGVLGWVILKHEWGMVPGPVPVHGTATLETALATPEGFALALAVTVVLLLVALTGVGTVARKRQS